MKKLLLMLLLPLGIIAQEKIEVYEYKNGIKEITPKQIIEINKEEISIYSTINGIQNIIPDKVIQPNGEIYNVTNGVKEIVPIGKLEVAE